ncbi:DNA-binding transcriptional regulator, MarR family [Virgibacillus subterraneus]|uniref:DNA-binding transcriptional regulator, MarR family n=1 Tax=Virgibacillus subterraneus TaxID=621109 RepID=A0A1H9K0X6_9BACI|nr:MarR family transcriptional regulator [Virgibacillus subterraneus]SEQ92573.1 DNA-binding transcriptional regulator, MarR family [Virgibacillus subterraneus]
MEDFLTLDNQLCFAIYETSSQFTKLYSKVLHPFGITYPQYLVLLALWEKDGPTVKEMGERLNLGTGTLTPLIKRMEANGWVKKERTNSDERKVYVFVQPKAIEEKDAINQSIASEVNTCNIELYEYEQLMSQLKVLHDKLMNRNNR